MSEEKETLAKRKAVLISNLLHSEDFHNFHIAPYNKYAGFNLIIETDALTTGEFKIPYNTLNIIFTAVRKPDKTYEIGLRDSAFELLYDIISKRMNKEIAKEEKDTSSKAEDSDEEETLHVEDPIFDPSAASSSKLKDDPEVTSIDLTHMGEETREPYILKYDRDPVYPSSRSDYGIRYDEATILKILQSVDGALIPLDKDLKRELEYPDALLGLLKLNHRIARVFFQDETADAYNFIVFMLSLDSNNEVIQGPQFSISIDKREIRRSGLAMSDIPRAIRKVMGNKSLITRLINQKNVPYKMAEFINRGDVLSQYKKLRRNVKRR